MVGIPLTKTAPVKEGRFPCEDCPCGCSSAEFCWDQCCCHSDLEKLRWAAEHEVTPPDFLLARVAGPIRTNAVASSETSKSVTSCCCISGVKLPAKLNKVQQVVATVAAMPTKTCVTDPNESACTTRPRGSRLVLLESAAKCRGVEFVWTLLSSVVVDIKSWTMPGTDAPFLFLLPVTNERAESAQAGVDPPVP